MRARTGIAASLAKGSRAFIDCYLWKKNAKRLWFYIKVNSDAHAGQRGWVRDGLLYWPL
ncbi:MAG TPA: hypothetical protein VIU15_27735 [Streptomyces sp.]